MAAPTVTMQQLIEAGSHFGHQTHRWNPRMKPYIFGARNGIHIIDLSQTVPLFARALDFVAADRAFGRQGAVRRHQAPGAGRDPRAPRCFGSALRQPPLARRHADQLEDHQRSIKYLKTLDEQLSGDTAGLTKKEVLELTRKRDKLEMSLGGIRDMGGIPDVMFVIDANKEDLAIKEANVLGIPVVAVLDTNVDPEGIAFPIPGNDDAARAIRLYCDAVAKQPRAARAKASRIRVPTLVRWKIRRKKLRGLSSSTTGRHHALVTKRSYAPGRYPAGPVPAHHL